MRTNVISVFPDGPSVTRLVGSILREKDDEWHALRGYLSLEPMKKSLEPQPLVKANLCHLHLHQFIKPESFKT